MRSVETTTALPPTTAEVRLPPAQWNETDRPYPQVCLHELFEAQARRTPESVAVADQHQHLTYRQLNACANQLARHLRKLGVGPDVLVGVAVDRSVDLLVALLGVMKAGGAYLPLDPDYPQERLNFMARDSGLRFILTQEALQPKLPAVAQRVCLDSHGEVISQQSGEDFSSGAGPNNLVYVIYTSGSTGLPKGVQIAHRSLVNVMESLRLRPGMTAQDTFLATTTLSFDIATVELYLPLIAGGRVFVASLGIANDVQRFQECLATSGATVLQGTPTFWRLLIESGWGGDRKLRLFCGGEALRGALAKEMLRRSASVWNMYAPSETTVYSTVFQVVSGDAPMSIGTAIANTQTYILDEALRPVPAGEVGELHLGGDGLARGYLNRPELTAEKFIPNPFSNQPGARLYKTGDLARYLPDGNIEFIGRVDHQVKIRGFRIELGEIETVLAEHPAVETALVVVWEETVGDRRLVAYVIPRAGQAPAVAELGSFLKAKLPEWMLPARFEFLEAMPLTPSGKVDRRALPRPGGSRPPLAESDTVPRTEVERVLERVFAAVLGLDWVGIDEDFIDLGGDSLRALELFRRIEQRFGRRISLAALYQAPSVRELAAFLSSHRSTYEVLAALPIQPRGSRPPFFCSGAGPLTQRLAQRMGPDQPFLGLVFEEAEDKTIRIPYSIEDLAAILLRKLREKQPAGPYFLGGWCWDGIVAYEMARQLRASGEEVALLVLIDSTLPPQARGTQKKHNFAAKISRLTEALAWHFSQIGKQGWVHLLKFGWGTLAALNIEAQYLIYRFCIRMGFYMQRWHYACHFALWDYRPQPYAGRMALIRGRSESQMPDSEGDDAGWGALAKGELQVRFLPFFLDRELFREPKVTALAGLLNELLLQAQAHSIDEEPAAQARSESAH